jgi:hypothetical protein
VSVLASAPVGRRALTVGMTETEKFLGESNEAVKTDTFECDFWNYIALFLVRLTPTIPWQEDQI